MKRYISIILTLCIVQTISIPVSSQGFRAGAAYRIITPDPLLPVSGGIGQPKAATEKKGELFARAFVLQQGTTTIAIVSVDNLGWPSVLADRSRALVPGIPAANIIIGATHTHSAPDSYAFPDEKGEHGADLKYLAWCTSMIAEAINEAYAKLEPAAIRIAVGDAKGAIAYNYYAPDLYDPRCGVIQAVATTGERKGKTIATLVNYASHPEIIGSGRGILTPDFCGPLYDRIESKTGGMALYLNSAQGGMVTADTRRPGGQEANTWEECIRIGELLADEALRIIGGSEMISEPGLFCTSRNINLPVESPMMRYILKSSVLKYPSLPDGSVSTRLNLVNIGPAQILTVPGEALPNIGYYLKRKMNSKMPFLFGLTNDAFGYLLTSVDFQSFKKYDYISRTSLGERTGDIYIEEAIRLINESPKPSVLR